MFYFITIHLQEYHNVENSLRNKALKRHTSLDFKKTSFNIDYSDKLFLGTENDKFLKLTRLKGPFGQLLPKIIIQFDKKDFKSYKIRLSFLSTLFAIFLLSTLSINFTYSLIEEKWDSDLFPVLFLSVIFFCLNYLEYTLTKKSILKAIKN